MLAAFKEWASKTEIEKGVSVSMWIGDGVASKVAKVSKAKVKRPKKPVAAKPSTTVDEALAIAGIDPRRPITEAQAFALIEELKESNPASAANIIDSITGATKKGVLTEVFIKKQTQEFLDFLPPGVVAKLPPLKFSVELLPRSRGRYRQGGTVRLSKEHLTDEQGARRTIFHELTHWLHLEQPNNSAWVKDIKDHFEARTAGEKIANLKGYESLGKNDKWWEAYMGRIYGTPSEATHLGSEFPTRNFELLSDPARLAKIWSQSDEARADIQLALKGLYL